MTQPAIVLFDGVCSLCERSVLFVIDRDPHKRFRFASLQSAVGQELWRGCHERGQCKGCGEPGNETAALTTMVLVEGDRCFTESTAALRVVRKLSGLWPLLYVCIVVPRALRDPIYRSISRHRYRWFGRQDSCRLPGDLQSDRFL